MKLDTVSGIVPFNFMLDRSRLLHTHHSRVEPVGLHKGAKRLAGSFTFREPAVTHMPPTLTRCHTARKSRHTMGGIIEADKSDCGSGHTLARCAGKQGA